MRVATGCISCGERKCENERDGEVDVFALSQGWFTESAEIGSGRKFRCP
ncbi:hypothetical protein COLO4_05557 [Corchorus olitorius]|uniref:Uncharacterized protein n=1 Tax=Corchorus olitorius TaxID=93759 RepID=A0A1R3KQI0_9ROSI|nr:hypothetical protein COLO4_05557 [Corchorus olitorius]